MCGERLRPYITGLVAPRTHGFPHRRRSAMTSICMKEHMHATDVLNELDAQD